VTEFLEIHQGTSPLVLSMPHSGQDLAPEVEACLNDEGKALADTDWWIERLYDFYPALGASVVRTKLSRYVIDLNRNPSGQSLYPGQATTGLCPTETFDGAPIYQASKEPDETEVARRLENYFTPYHDALRQMIEATVARHGFALLFDCHSIRSVVPRLFEGLLPVFNIGTNDGKASAPELGQILADTCAAKDNPSYVLNGRFMGGWITRHYGDPANHVHAVQLELSQAAYMIEKPPWTYLESEAAITATIIRSALQSMLDWSTKNLSKDSLGENA
jgi:N-formylglutamate deformylase